VWSDHHATTTIILLVPKKCNAISGEMIRVRKQFSATKSPREAATTISFNTTDFWRQAFLGAARRQFLR